MWTADAERVEQLYLHVPFCKTRCPYCDYPVLCGARGDSTEPPDAEDWTGAVAKELGLRRARTVTVDAIRTVLVGGGTPSVLGPALAGLVARDILADIGSLQEWTIEANPEDIDVDLVDRWVDAGVTRIGVGVQSLRPRALDWLGRRHDPQDAYRAMDVLASASLGSWNIDWIFGLPTEIDPDPVTRLADVIERGVPHVSLYELTPGRIAPRSASTAGATPSTLPTEDMLADQYLALHDTLTSAGYEAYQMTAFSLPGHRSRHAEGVLQEGAWLGLGPGAHSRLGGVRSWNLLDWGGYTRSVGEGVLPIERTERQDTVIEREERIRSLLLRSAGVPSRRLSVRERDVVDRWIRDGHAITEASSVRLTPTGWLLLDGLARELAGTDGVG